MDFLIKKIVNCFWCAHLFFLWTGKEKWTKRQSKIWKNILFERLECGQFVLKWHLNQILVLVSYSFVFFYLYSSESPIISTWTITVSWESFYTPSLVHIFLLTYGKKTYEYCLLGKKFKTKWVTTLKRSWKALQFSEI